MIPFALAVLGIFATATVGVHLVFDVVTWRTVVWAAVAVVSVLAAAKMGRVRS